MKVKVTTFVTILILACSSAFAGGFQINEHGARAMALGGAFTGLANDPSAIYFNAAGLTQLRGFNFMLGTTAIAPGASFRGVSPSITEYDMEKQVFFPTHFWGSYNIDNQWAVGLGFTTPFGLGTKWGEDWVGKYLAIETNLMTFTISPVVAYRVLDNLSISAGFVYSFANVTITRKNPQAPFEGDAFIDLEGKDNSAFGYNFGILYKPVEQLSIGVSYHSKIKYDFSGTATADAAQQLKEAGKIPYGDVTAELTTPVNFAVGIAYKIMPQLTVSADYQYVGWSSYDTLKVDFTNPAYTDLASPRMYKDTYIARLGVEYNYNEKLAVRGGLYFDKNPVDPKYLNPSLPDANRLGFSAGLGYKITKNLGVDLSYLFIRASQITVDDSEEYYTEGNTPFNGTYNSYANIVSLSLSYGF